MLLGEVPCMNLLCDCEIFAYGSFAALLCIGIGTGGHLAASRLVARRPRVMLPTSLMGILCYSAILYCTLLYSASAHVQCSMFIPVLLLGTRWGGRGQREYC